MPPENLTSSLTQEVIEHHLRLMGLRTQSQLALFHRPTLQQFPEISAAHAKKQLVILIQPDENCANSVGLLTKTLPPPINCMLMDATLLPKNPILRSLFEVKSFTHPLAEVILRSSAGDPLWLWITEASGNQTLVLGTDIGEDLVRFRQGDPSLVKLGRTDTLWGIPGERPNYLFEEQLKGLPYGDRQADYWAWALAELLSRRLALPRLHMLPNNASGAIVITGDDDQAELVKYYEQEQHLAGLPITWILHPRTRHTKKTLAATRSRLSNMDLGLHPDALDAPTQYNELFHKQAKWYQSLTGDLPISVRNHGFLNDGYWGHLSSWLGHGIDISSNLPGFDGRVLNGSLLPGRVAWRGNLSPHWSVLTAIGDGIRFSGGKSDSQAAQCMLDFAQAIQESGIPGVMVLNLHPQNISETIRMHAAVHEIVRSGFLPWNLRQCLNWFNWLDGGKNSYATTSPTSSTLIKPSKLLNKVRRLLAWNSRHQKTSYDEHAELTK